METRKLLEEDFEILKAIQEKMAALMTSHSKARLQFLRTEAIQIQNIAVTESEMNQFAESLALSSGIPKEDLHKWKLDFEKGELSLIIQDPAPSVAEVESKPEPEITKKDPKLAFLEDMRNKYKR